MGVVEQHQAHVKYVAQHVMENVMEVAIMTVMQIVMTAVE